MTDDERIAELKTTPPHVDLSFWEKASRNIGRGLLAVALLLGGYAVVDTIHVAECINKNLGQRSAPTAADAAAHIAYASAQQNLAVADAAVSKALGDAIAAGSDKTRQQAAEHEFVAAFLAQQPVAAAANAQTAVYVKTLTADQAQRTAHPLGKC